MKTIRLGNDISIQWTITRLGEPEDFEGKVLSVQLIDKLGNPQLFNYAIQDNVIIGTFYGKDQVTNGTYRLLLVENEGEPYMVTLDYIDCFCLSNKMKNQTSNGSDTTSTINTEVIEVTSDIDLAPDLSIYATKEYVDSSFYNKDEIDSSFYNKDEVDEMISDIPALDTYTKSQIDQKIEDVSSNIPTKVSELDNDSGFINSDDASVFLTKYDASIYLTADDVSTFITEDDLSGYAKAEDVPTKVSQLQNDEGYLVQNDVSTFITRYDASIYLTADDVSTLVDEDDLSTVAFSGDYGDLLNKPDLSHYFDDAVYDSSTKRINFKHDNTVVAFIDATDFIKDGMVDSVVIENGYVVITFNTDAGKEAIRIPITDIFNPANYYDKTAIDLLLQGKQDTILDLGQIRLDASAGKIAYGWGNHAEAGYLVQNDVSTFITRNDASVFLVQDDVSTFITQTDASVFLTKTDASIYLTSNDVSTFVEESELATVATTGDYDDLENKPTIPAAPVQSDWNESSTDSLAFIRNKPTIPASPEQSDWNESSTGSLAYIKNKPTIITLADVSSGFEVKAWKGTQAQYDALQVIEQNKLYIILPTT